MHGRVLRRMRGLVRRRRYVMTTHADEEADEDGLSVLDIESVFLTGAVVERQRVVTLASGSTWSAARRLIRVTPLWSQSSGCGGSLYILTVYEG